MALLRYIPSHLLWYVHLPVMNTIWGLNSHYPPKLRIPSWAVLPLPAPFPKTSLSLLFLLANWSFPKETNLIADCWKLITYDTQRHFINVSPEESPRDEILTFN